MDPRRVRVQLWLHHRVGQQGAGELHLRGPAHSPHPRLGDGRAIPLRQDLFKPEINIRAGTWYLHRAIQYWSAKPKANPLPYALAEYNAGRSNALRWAARDQNDPNVFWNEITYPSTRRYVRDILRNYRRNR